jgi:glycylpeptide N-tetradecanoyltransferase
MTMVRTIKLYSLPETPLTLGVRPMVSADVPSCFPKLNAYLRRFAIAPQLSEDEFRHWMLTREGVVYT